jgi:hypothetical protein
MIRRLVFLGCFVCLGGWVMAGCGGDPPETDAGMTGDDAGMGGDDAGQVTAETIQVVTMRDAMGMATEFGPANFDCSPTAPTGSGDPVAFDVIAESFGQDGSPTIEGLTIQFFADNNVPASETCTPPACLSVTSGSDGSASVMDVAGSWYSYRVLGGNGTVMGAPRPFIPVVQYNEVAPAAGGSGTINAVSEMIQNTIILLLGRSQETGTGVVTGGMSDCDGRTVVNAHIRIFDSLGPIDLSGSGDTDPFSFYFNGERFPAVRQTDTNTDGLYGAGNITVPGDGLVSVGIYGALTDGAEEELLGCEEIRLNAGGITIVNIGPTRSDGSQDCDP